MIVISPFHPEHQQDVQDVVLTIQRDEFGIPITLEDSLILWTSPASVSVAEGISGWHWLAQKSWER